RKRVTLPCIPRTFCRRAYWRSCQLTISPDFPCICRNQARLLSAAKIRDSAREFRHLMSMPFIAFEGLDGSGQTSLLQALQTQLQSHGYAYIRTREPGGTPLGDEIRELILRTSGIAPTPRTELLLYEASRSQHVDQVIRPSLAKGQWVLCDRFSASSVAF